MNTIILSRGELPNFTLQVSIFVSCMDFPGMQSLLDGYVCSLNTVLLVEATVMKLLEKITVAFAQAAFEQVHCENKIAVGRDVVVSHLPSPVPVEPGQVVLPSLVTQGVLSHLLN